MPVPPHDDDDLIWPDPAPTTMSVPPDDDLIQPDPVPPPHDDRIRPGLAPQHMKGLVSLVDKLQRACTALADHVEESALPADWNWDALPSVAVIGVFSQIYFPKILSSIIFYSFYSFRLMVTSLFYIKLLYLVINYLMVKLVFLLINHFDTKDRTCQ